VLTCELTFKFASALTLVLVSEPDFVSDGLGAQALNVSANSAKVMSQFIVNDIVKLVI